MAWLRKRMNRTTFLQKNNSTGNPARSFSVISQPNISINDQSLDKRLQIAKK